MEHQLTDAQVEAFNALYETAAERIKGVVYLDAHRARPLGFWGKIKLNRSIGDFERCLALVPDHWPSLFFMAKAYERLGNFARALELFEQAMALEPDNDLIPQEASLTCVHLDDIEKAILYSAEAIRRNPEKAVLRANHAMNLLIAGRDAEALEEIERALGQEPEDKISQHIHGVIREVLAGTRKRPGCAEAIG